MESGIHGRGIRNLQTWNPESTAWNPESKTLLDYLTWGEKYMALMLKGHCHVIFLFLSSLLIENETWYLM